MKLGNEVHSTLQFTHCVSNCTQERRLLCPLHGAQAWQMERWKVVFARLTGGLQIWGKQQLPAGPVS